MATPPEPLLRVALWQGVPRSGQAERMLALMEDAIGSAAAGGARLIVFPELVTTGYNLGRRLLDLAQPADGPWMRRLAALARMHRIGIAYGYAEREGATTRNALNVLDSAGDLVATYRKTHLFGDAERALFTPGDTLPVVECDGIKLGLLICYDVELPETVRTLALRGAELVVVPTANMLPYWDVPTTLVRARALENGVPIVYANWCGVEGDLEYTGLSAIVSRLGTDLARADTAETLLVADVPLRSPSPAPTLSTQLRDLRPELYETPAGMPAAI